MHTGSEDWYVNVIVNVLKGPRMTQPDFTLLHAGNKEQGRGVCLCVCLPLNIVQ